MKGVNMSYCRATKTFFKPEDGIKAINQFGEEHLYSPFANFKYCLNCGKRMVEEPDEKIVFAKDSKGNILCDECHRNYFICGICGKYEKMGDRYRLLNADGEETLVCLECRGKYTVCDDCGCHKLKEETVTIPILNEDGDKCEITVCASCSEKYEMCACCGMFYYKYEIRETSDGYRLCEDCYTTYTYTCEQCKSVYYNESNTVTVYSNDKRFRMCPSCKDDGSRCIRNYSYKPRALKKGGERKKEYFGFEIEVSGAECFARKFKEEFGDETEQELYIKHDGSVNGFEIVTHPMTREYFYRNFVPKLDKGMKFLRTHGFKGHNKCGIHIHVSTGAITNDMLKRMVVLMYSRQKSTYKTWLAITQRKAGSMERWANMNPQVLKRGWDYNATSDRARLKVAMRELNQQKIYHPNARSKPKLTGNNRYSAINLCNSKTIEFRIFNSNIRTERVIKDAQVIFALIDFSKTNMIPSMKNYLNYIYQNREVYKELYDFLIEKRIFIPPEQKQTLKQAMELFKTDSVTELKEMLNTVCVEQNLEVDDNDEEERNAEECA